MSGRIALRVPKRGCTPPVANGSPRSAESRCDVPASPPGPAAKTMWSKRMVDSHPTAIGMEHRGRRSARGRRGRVQRERRPGAQVRLARRGQHVVRRLPHQGDQLGGVGDVDRLDADMGLGVAGAVPVEVVATRAPAAPVVLADGDLEVGGLVVPLDVAERTPDRQLASTRPAWSRRNGCPCSGRGRAARSHSHPRTPWSCGRCRRRPRPWSCARRPRRSRSSRSA